MAEGLHPLKEWEGAERLHLKGAELGEEMPPMEWEGAAPLPPMESEAGARLLPKESEVGARSQPKESGVAEAPSTSKGAVGPRLCSAEEEAQVRHS